MTAKNALWIDLAHKEECDQAIQVLQEKEVEFQTWDVDRMNPVDMDGQNPPILITGSGSFAGIASITAYARIPQFLLTPDNESST